MVTVKVALMEHIFAKRDKRFQEFHQKGLPAGTERRQMRKVIF